MPHSGITSTTVDRLAIGPAIVSRNGTIIGTLGSSATAEEIVEYRQPRIAGLTVPIEGMDRAVSRTLRITGEFLEHSAAESAKWSSGVNVAGEVTPPDAGVLFGATQYDDVIAVEFVLGNGGTFKAEMASGIITNFPFASQDPGEGATTVTWEARSHFSNPDDAPYTYEFVGAGVSADAHLQLITDLGGDSIVAGFYDTTDGITGAAHASVVNGSGVVNEWWDYRGETGFGPKLVGTGTSRPAWDGTAKTITSDGVDDNLATAVSAVYDLAAGKSLVIVGSVTTSYAAAIAESNLTARFFGLREQTGTIRGVGIPGNVDSGIASGATRRLSISTIDAAGTTLGIEVPDDAKATAVATDTGAGNNALTLFSYWPGNGMGVASIRAVIVLNRDATAPDVAFIKAWAVAQHSVTLA